MGAWYIIPHNTTSVKAGCAALLLLVPAACSATDPAPSPRYDGYYAGTRQSDRTDACGISQAHGLTSASVAGGRVAIPLFTPGTQMTGTVGEDGTVRASGIWTNPTGGFPGVTVLNGTIRNNVLQGKASDFRCHTDIHLEKALPSHRRVGVRSPAATVPPRN